MASIDDILIKPSNGNIFCAKQGSFFWDYGYAYESSDGLKLRSREECDWHFVLSGAGIYHTYEPNIRHTRRRPDFGVANNFLIEVCGMVQSPAMLDEDSVKVKEYKKTIQQKRKIYQDLGYNIAEIYVKDIILNGYIITDVNAFDFVVGVVKQHNPDWYCIPRTISFKRMNAAQFQKAL